MIKYDLICKCGATFESWFSNSSEFDLLYKKKFIKCIYCDSTKIKKVKQVSQEKGADPMKVKVRLDDMYTYNERGLDQKSGQGIMISGDSIIYNTSGLLNSQKNTVLSYLHKFHGHNT